MDKAARLRDVKFVRDELQKLDWEDQHLHLGTFGFPTPDYDMTIQDCLLQGNDSDLQELASLLRGEQEVADVAAGAEASLPVPLKIFASHLAMKRAIVSDYAAQFQRYGIELFVAHDSIEPDSVWADEVLKMLRTSHCGLVFLHDKFGESGWCDQEVGWLLGRGVPVPVLKFEATAPYGPLGIKQAISVAGRHIGEVVVDVLAVLRNSSDLVPHLVESLVVGLERSWNFHTTDLIWTQLQGFRELTPSQNERILQAAATNDQVRNAYCYAESRTYPELIQEFVKTQASYSAPLDEDPL